MKILSSAPITAPEDTLTPSTWGWQFLPLRKTEVTLWMQASRKLSWKVKTGHHRAHQRRALNLDQKSIGKDHSLKVRETWSVCVSDSLFILDQPTLPILTGWRRKFSRNCHSWSHYLYGMPGARATEREGNTPIGSHTYKLTARAHSSLPERLHFTLSLFPGDEQRGTGSARADVSGSVAENESWPSGFCLLGQEVLSFKPTILRLTHMSAFQDETVHKTDRPLQQAKPSLLRLDYFPSQLLLLSPNLNKYKGWDAIFFTESFRPYRLYQHRHRDTQSFSHEINWVL